MELNFADESPVAAFLTHQRHFYTKNDIFIRKMAIFAVKLLFHVTIMMRRDLFRLLNVHIEDFSSQISNLQLDFRYLSQLLR